MVGLCKVFRPTVFTCSPFALHLSNFELDSLICLEIWFNCLLLLLKDICLKIEM